VIHVLAGNRIMTLGELLQKSQDAVVRRWLDGLLATYGGDASAVFKRQKNRFANPVGHSLRIATLGIFEALTEGMDAEEVRRHLGEIMKLRAVQEFSPSQAVGFVFQLKQAIREELAQTLADPRFSSELAEFDARIDRIALAAFDVYVQCRERVHELRLNEVKRRVSWTVDKMNQRETRTPQGTNAQGEDL